MNKIELNSFSINIEKIAMSDENKDTAKRIGALGATGLFDINLNNSLQFMHKDLRENHENMENRMYRKNNAKNPIKEVDHLKNRVSNLAQKMNVPMVDAVEIGSPGFKPKMKNFADLANKVPNQDPSVINDLRKDTIRAKHYTSDATLLHELGHHKNWIGRSDKSKFLNNLLRAGTGSAASLGLSAYTATKKDPDSDAGKYFLAASAPKLIDEAVASGRAVNTMRKMHGWKGGLKKSLHLLPAFGTYLAGATLPLMGTHFNKSFRGTKEQEKLAGLADFGAKAMSVGKSFMSNAWKMTPSEKLMNVGLPAAMTAPSLFDKQDQEGKSRADRVSGLAGNVVGGIAGNHAGNLASKAITSKLPGKIGKGIGFAASMAGSMIGSGVGQSAGELPFKNFRAKPAQTMAGQSYARQAPSSPLQSPYPQTNTMV